MMELIKTVYAVCGGWEERLASMDELRQLTITLGLSWSTTQRNMYHGFFMSLVLPSNEQAKTPLQRASLVGMCTSRSEVGFDVSDISIAM